MEIFIKIILFHLPVLVIPGPNLILVIKNSMSGGIKNGFSTSCGICIGIALHIFYTLIVFSSLSKQIFSRIENFKFLAALYIGYLGYKGFISASKSMKFNVSGFNVLKYFNSFKDGFLIDVLNPLIGMFYFSLWIVIKIDTTSGINLLIYGILSLVIVITWFTFISFIFSRSNFKEIYMRYHILLEKSTSAILILFALLLIN